MRKTLNKGFTLIELMIVVAIIGILAAIAIPNFIRYQLKSKQAEAKAVLGGIKTSQESFRGDYDNYLTAVAANPGAVPGVSKLAWLPRVCNPLCARNAIVNCNEFECAGYRPAGAVYFNYATTQQLGGGAAQPEWAGCGDSDLDGDGALGSVSFCTDNSQSGGCNGAAVPPCAGAAPIAQLPNEVTNRDTSNF